MASSRVRVARVTEESVVEVQAQASSTVSSENWAMPSRAGRDVDHESDAIQAFGIHGSTEILQAGVRRAADTPLEHGARTVASRFERCREVLL